MADIQIRQAVESDQRTIRRMIRAAQLDPSGLHWSHFLIAEHEGRTVGIGQIRPYPRCRELGSLLVVPDYRQRGVGTLLVNALLANEAGDLYLECASHNEAYYTRFGFKSISWWQAPMPLTLKVGISQLGRLFGVRVLAMKRDRPA